jgi:putative OmpL-like beta-barrel porin-2
VSRRIALFAALLISPVLATAAEAPKVTVNGTVDSYFTLNLTNGQDYNSPTNGVVGLTGFNFNYAKVGTVAESGPATLKLDLVYGPMGQSVTGLPPGGTPTNITRLFVQQALVAMKFDRLTVEAGRFVTPCGFEVYEAKDNWLYSHGLLFNFAMPTAHEGVRVSTALSPEFTVVGALANGSDLFTNDVGISQSPYKTLILGGAYAKEDNTASVYLFISKDPVTTEDAVLLDGIYTRTMGATAFNVSADFGKLGSSSWLGVGGSIKHALAPDGLKIVGRVEYLKDDDAIHTGLVDPTDGTGVGLFSLTGGVNYPVGSNAELRAELRLDRASAKVYGVTDPSETMATFTAAAIAWF